MIFNVNWLGDVLFSTACIRNVRLNFPDSFIACVIPSRCYPILKDNPHLDEVIIFDEKDRHKGILEKMTFIKQLKYRKFDVVFLLHRSFTRALICRLADIPQRLGYYTKKRGFLLTQKIIAPHKDSLHRIDYYLNILEKAGLKIEDRYTEFFFNHQDEEAVNDFLKKNGVGKGDFLACFNAGGNWLPKRWPVGYWARLADELISRGFKVIFSGSSADSGLVKEIQSQIKEKPIIATNVFNLKQLAALCARADLFITADTGPLHIANAANAKKIIALFGPTSPEITGPFPRANCVILQKDVGCKIPCYEVSCKDNRCMQAISVEDVLKAVESCCSK